MNRELERRFVRIEAKINDLVRAVSWILAFVVGFGVYFLATAKGYEWAGYYGFGVAIVAAAILEFRMRQWERWFPYDREN